MTAMVGGWREVGWIRVCGRVVVLMIDLLGSWICAVGLWICFVDSWILVLNYLC